MNNYWMDFHLQNLNWVAEFFRTNQSMYMLEESTSPEALPMDKLSGKARQISPLLPVTEHILTHKH